MSDRDDYVEVHVRMASFFSKYPKGSLQAHGGPQLLHVGEKTFLLYTAAAYRTPDDERPGIGTAWEPVPGPTPFTRDSEAQNAETSAWGRALAALGFETHNGIATKEDVQARTGDKPAPKPKTDKLSEKQRKMIYAILGKLDKDFRPPPPCADWKTHLLTVTNKDIEQLSGAEASKVIDSMLERRKQLESEAIKEAQDAVAEAPDDDDIPF